MIICCFWVLDHVESSYRSSSSISGCRKSALSRLAPLEAVLFDVDGTLCDSDPLHYYAFREMLQEVILPSLTFSLNIYFISNTAYMIIYNYCSFNTCLHNPTFTMEKFTSLHEKLYSCRVLLWNSEFSKMEASTFCLTDSDGFITLSWLWPQWAINSNNLFGD